MHGQRRKEVRQLANIDNSILNVVLGVTQNLIAFLLLPTKLQIVFLPVVVNYAVRGSVPIHGSRYKRGEERAV